MLVYKGLQVLVGTKPLLIVLTGFRLGYMHTTVFTAHHVFGFKGRFYFGGHFIAVKMSQDHNTQPYSDYEK